jgi:hypothetical protein
LRKLLGRVSKVPLSSHSYTYTPPIPNVIAPKTLAPLRALVPELTAGEANFDVSMVRRLAAPLNSKTNGEMIALL